MADDPNTPTPAPAPAAPAPTDPPAPGATPTPDPQGDEPLREPGKKALDAERAARAKAEADLVALRKEIEDSKKSAEQKAADDLKAAQAEAATNAAKALKYEIAAANDIPLSLAARLTGTTREEIEADAATFKTQIPAGATPPRTPTPDPGQGPQPHGTRSEADANYEALFGPDTRK